MEIDSRDDPEKFLRVMKTAEEGLRKFQASAKVVVTV
jgi:hypothetical protein